LTAKDPQSLACDLAAMNPEQRRRYEVTGKQLRDSSKQVKELPSGYAFEYAPDPALFLAAAEFITLESRCCSFYHFTLEKEPGEGSLWLRITGPEAAKSFIKAVLAPETSCEETAGEAMLRLTRDTFGTLPPEELAKLPTDFAINHDHYIHGASKVHK
jgi:hypothetical protein